MPYVAESRYAELLRLELAVDTIKPHVDAWIDMVENHVESLPEPSGKPAGDATRDEVVDRVEGRRLLIAMKIGMGALYPAHAVASSAAADAAEPQGIPGLG